MNVPSYLTLADFGCLLWGDDCHEVWELDGQLWLAEFANGTAYVSRCVVA